MPRCVYLDFETYYDGDYTLKKLSVEAYVRDARFEATLLGVAVDDDPPLILQANDIAAGLAALHLERDDVFTFVQNYRFDGFILSDRYNVYPVNPCCTRVMSRWAGLSRLTRESLAAQNEFLGTAAKGEFIHNMQGKHLADLTPSQRHEYEEYCKGDVTQLRENVRKLLSVMTPDAMRFMFMTLKMYTEPVFRLDAGHLEAYRQQLIRAQEASQERLQHLFRFDTREEFLKALRSKAKFSEMLESIGGVVPMKLSEKKTATARRKLEEKLRDPALPEAERAKVQTSLDNEEYTVMEPALAKTDLSFIELQASDNPDMVALATARAENNSSIALSRCNTFLDIASRGALPVGLEAYQAHTGRYTAGTSEGVKSDASNVQNLQKRGNDKTLRECVLAPEGYSIVACDSSQIEARTLAWLAREQGLLDDFRNGDDPYCRMASVAYSTPYDVIHYYTKGEGARGEDRENQKKYKNMRNIGKCLVLQLGYYAGSTKLAQYLAQSGTMLANTKPAHDREAKRLVQVYRQHNSAIRAFWGDCQQVLNMLVNGWSGYFGGPKGRTFWYDGIHNVFGRKVPGIMLPDGYWLLYPNLRVEMDEEKGKPEYVYDAMERGRKVKLRLHAGIVANNCLAEGSLVFTDNGWKPIELVKLSDRVWDGVDFVAHSGVVCNGVQTCIPVCGVWATADHPVLEQGRWVSFGKSIRPDRASIWKAYCYRACRQFAQAKRMVLSLFLRQCGNSCGYGVAKGTEAWAAYRLQEVQTSDYVRSASPAWYDSYIYLSCLAQHDESLLQNVGTSISKLRSTGYFRMRPLAPVCEFLRGYGRELASRFDFGTERQQWQLHSRQLLLDDFQREYEQSSEVMGKTLYANGRRVWDSTVYRIVSFATGLARRSIIYSTQLWKWTTTFGREGNPQQKKVYDILNCGPRSRFVVKGTYPFIVHNCTQGLAFALMRWQALKINERYPIKINVHDSWSVCVPDEEAVAARDWMMECMRSLPDWADGLPVDCEATIGKDFCEV